MHTPTPSQLLQVWERGGDQPDAARALLLLASSCDDIAADALAALPLGRRDALLLQLRTCLFGSEIVGVTHCPRCDATVEAVFDGDALLSPHAAPEQFEYSLRAHGADVRFRLPDSNDLLALEGCVDADTARMALLGRCVIAAACADQPRELHSLPEVLLGEVAQAMAAADPQADLQLAFTCPDCGLGWQPAFDIARYLWQELHAWALRMLREVDTLARTYHWREADILALGEQRRQIYLELCTS